MENFEVPDTRYCDRQFDLGKSTTLATDELLFTYYKTNYPTPDNSLIIADWYEMCIYEALWDYLSNGKTAHSDYSTWSKFVSDENECKGAWDYGWGSYNSIEIANLLRELIVHITLQGCSENMSRLIGSQPSPITVVQAIIDFCDRNPNQDGKLFITSI